MRLVLTKDTLTELTPEQLTRVNGAAPAPLTPSCPLVLKLQELLSDAAC